MAWVNNEDGPDCPCGEFRLVKVASNQPAILVCMFHTGRHGLHWDLPAERPANWPALTGDECEALGLGRPVKRPEDADGD